MAIPQIPPTITSVSPANDSITTGTIVLQAVVTSNITNISSVTYAILNGNTAISTGVMSSNSSIYQAEFLTNSTFPYDATVLKSQNLTLTITAVDTNGTSANESTNWILDNSLPIITITEPNGTYETSFNLNITLTDLQLSHAAYNITNSSGNIVQQNTSSPNSPSFTWQDSVNLPGGNYTINIFATDSAGNIQTSQASFRLNIDSDADEDNIPDAEDKIIGNNSNINNNFGGLGFSVNDTISERTN